ncbi:DUF3413 domain-containing protein [Alishewanella sp. HL-SH05]|uniref:DUF3413 domain-containing protein n=1 Tax=Alishewanella sp. HL-SH05 TaxID=3461145 RepID=UPI004042AFAC
MVLEQNLSLVKKVNRLLNWGHWFSFFNMLLALVITASFWWAEPLPVTFLGWSYLVLTWLGHTAFICFMFFILTIFPLSLIFPYQRHIRGLAAALASIGLVLLIFDAYVYNQLGYHLGSASYDQTIDLLRQQIVTNLRNFLLIVAVVGSMLFAIELTISNFCWKKITRLGQSGIGKPALMLFFGSFMLSHVLHIYADAKLQWDITRQDNVLPFSYPATAKSLLARYQLVDLTQRAQRQAERLSLETSLPLTGELRCTLPAQQSTLLLFSQPLTESQINFFRQQQFRLHEQHFAPNNAPEALLNVLYGQFMVEASDTEALKQRPSWLSPSHSQAFSVVNRDPKLSALLPWATESTTFTPFSMVFDADPTQNWADYQQYAQIVIVPLHSNNTKFQLAPVTALTRWPALSQQLKQHNSQQLDWLPTLVAAAGCDGQQRWLSDNLLAPKALPKLNISQQDIISIRKDKMLILRQDGSYGVWSAGTLVPLNDKLDVPMLIDALKRLED